MQRKNTTAGLADIFRLYTFVKALPKILSCLVTLFGEDQNSQEKDVPLSEESLHELRESFVAPLSSLCDKVVKFEELVEHAIDMSQLPELYISAKHDPELYEIQEEMDGCQREAEDLLEEAREKWAAFADVKLEQHSMYGLIMRTTKGDDERTLRANNSKVQILTIQKVSRSSSYVWLLLVLLLRCWS